MLSIISKLDPSDFVDFAIFTLLQLQNRLPIEKKKVKKKLCISTLSITSCMQCFVVYIHSTYNGDVVNGLRHGVGTFVDSTGKLSYTGEWTNGKRNGKVEIFNYANT